jgi:hypothetical protein
MPPWSKRAVTVALFVSAGLAARAADAQVPPSSAERDWADREPSETRDVSHEAVSSEGSDAMVMEACGEATAALEDQNDGDEDGEPGFSRSGRSNGGGSGAGPSPQFRENFELIHRFRTLRSQQEVAIFGLHKRLARLTGRAAPAEPPGLGLVRASSAGTLSEQQVELAALMGDVRRNENLIKTLRSRLGEGAQ